MSTDAFVFLREVPSFAEVSRVLAPVGRLDGEGLMRWYVHPDADPITHIWVDPAGEDVYVCLDDVERVALDGFGRGRVSIIFTYHPPHEPIVEEMLRLMAAAWPVVIHDDNHHMVLGEDFSSVAAMQDLPRYEDEEDLEPDR